MQACWQCGCTRIEETAWIYVNGGEIAPGDGPTDQIWCPTCEDHYAQTADIIATVENASGSVTARLLKRDYRYAVTCAIDSSTGRASAREALTEDQARDWLLADYSPDVITYNDALNAGELLGVEP